MRLRCVEQDQVKLAVDYGADRATPSPQLVVVEMLIIELEAIGAQERTRLQRDGSEIDRAAANGPVDGRSAALMGPMIGSRIGTLLTLL